MIGHKHRPRSRKAPAPAVLAAPSAARGAPRGFGAPGRTVRLSVALGGRGRISEDEPGAKLLSSYAGLLYTGAPDRENLWRNLSLDSRTLDRIGPADLLELLCDLSPDISRALWDFLRLCNPGWEARAFTLGSADGEETIEPRAQAAIDTFLAQLTELYGAVDVVFGRLFIGAWMRGAFFAELVLDRAGRTPIDLATPDPRWVSWRRVADPDRGIVWQPVQWQTGNASEPVLLDGPTLRYVPVDPFPGKPWGRAPASPAVFTAIFLLSLLHDLRRVIQQQGYPRLDLSIDMERLAARMPPEIRDDPQEVAKWLNDIASEIAAAYSTLEPDDAYIHADWVTVNRPVGTVDSSSLGAVEGLIKALERFSTRALKTMPLLMATTDGVSEANANRQWEIVAAGVKSLQHLLEQALEHLFGVALRAQGLQAKVEFRFAELRASELLRDAQVEQFTVQNALAKYLAGWTSQDEAAQEGAGKAKADQPAPRAPAPPTGAPDAGGVQPEPGANRGVKVRDILLEWLREGVKPKGADAALPVLSEKVSFSEKEISGALEAWDEEMDGFEGLLDAAVIGA